MKRSQSFIAAVDTLSLEICFGVTKEKYIPNVPFSGEVIELKLGPSSAGPNEVILEPWPFEQEQVKVYAEGKRLHGHYKSQDALTEALKKAPAERIKTHLRRE